MSAASVRKAIQSALSNGRVNQREFRKIAKEAERDGYVSKSEERVIRRLADNHYHDGFTRGAKKESDSFFCRNDLPLAPPRMTTFGPAGEEDGMGCGSPGGGHVTSQELGEEDGSGGGHATTEAVGEEG